MPIIYLKHPVHGAKVATMELEAEYDEQNGWVRYNPDEIIETPAFLQQPQESVNQLEQPRRGRPRKTVEV